MADTEIKIGLSPEEVVAAFKKMAGEAGALAEVMEKSLGGKASQAVNDLKDNAEKGTNQITKFFSNMGQRIREDLKTAFDATGIMAGANMAKQIGEGVRAVMDMERAFDRLNVRMGLSARQMEDFKRSAGRVTSEAGVNIQDVQAGLLSAASRGNVKDPGQMTVIAQSLAQARQINPNLDTGTVSDDIAEILKRQGIQMTGATFSQTMDAINAATVHGGFKDSGDAAQNIAQIAPYAQQLGLDTRSMSGLAAVASRSGDSGENVLRQLLAQGTGVDHGARLNSLFGADVFKNGKLDPTALAKVSTDQFGDVSQQVLEQTTGISGASGSDLKMFIDTWKKNMGDFDDVVKGSNETADQFGVATNNFAAKIDMFKARVTNAGAEIGNSVLELAGGIIKGDSKQVGAGVSDLAGSLGHNAGDLAGAGALTLGAGLLMGGGIRGLVGSATARATGTQQVYVTNAAEISGGIGGVLSGVGQIGGAVGLGVAAGYGASTLLDKVTGGGYSNIVGKPGEWLADAMYGGDSSGTKSNMTPEQYADMVSVGFLKAMQQHDGNRPKVLTQPSAVRGQGASVGGR